LELAFTNGTIAVVPIWNNNFDNLHFMGGYKMDLFEVVSTRRSVRSYADKPIPEEILLKVLDAARLAPSGSNRQPTRLIVIRDRMRINALVPMCTNQSFIAQAPIVIVGVGKNLPNNRGGYMGHYGVLVDTAIVMDHLTLAARAEGLGTCWIGAFNYEPIKTFLKVPEDWNVVALSPIGYPKTQAFKPSENRIGLTEFIIDEQWPD